jgi:hypothetical protein
LFAKVRNYGRSHSNRGSVSNRNQMGARRFDHRVITDPNIPSNTDTSPAVKCHAPGGSTWHSPSEHLEKPVFKPFPERLPRTYRLRHILTF